MPRPATCVFPLAVCLYLAIAASPAAAAPQITGLSLRGLTIGQPTTLVIDGKDLLPNPRLIFAPEIITQQVKPGATANRLEIEVTLAPTASPGIYWLRLASDKGVSNPLAVGVDSLPQTSFTSTLSSLPLALHGSVPTGQVLTTKFAGKKDMPLVLDCEAQRIGSQLKPVVRLYDARGKQLAWSPPRRGLAGDARCAITLPADGEYTIELHDQLYRGAAPAFFRLKVGALQFADFTMPLAVTLGGKASLQLVGGNLPGRIGLDATAVAVPGEQAAAIPASPTFTGAAPRVKLSPFPEFVETPATPGELQTLPPAPLGISGKLSAKGEEDQFLLTVTPGEKLRFDTFAQRIGSPLDGKLVIRNAKGAQLATADDRPGTSDPGLDFTVPAKTNQLQVVLKDLSGEGGPDFVYRLEVRKAAQPDFSLTLPDDLLNIPAGGTQVVQVQANRMGYDGPISLNFEGLPNEISVQGNTVPAGAAIALVTLTAAATAPAAGVSRLVGRTDTPTPVVHAARFGDQAGSPHQPFLREQFAFAITQPAPISLAWAVSEGESLQLGSKLPARLQLQRRAGTAGNIRIRLITTQPMPTKKVKVNNQDKVVDDVESALRLEGNPLFKPDQTDVAVNILVPGDLPRKKWDLVLVADLLAKDNKTVVASIATPVRTFEPVLPFTLELAGAASAEGKAGAGDTGQFSGQVKRAPGFAQPVIVTLDGLPQGFTAPTALIAADQADFSLPLTFAFGSKVGELKNVKLVALAAPLSANSVRSNAIAVSVNVVPGEKPAAEPPKEVFEDDEAFTTLLTEGKGKAIPERRDKYSGELSLRVTPDQRYSPMLPNLGVKIRENPGPGEYRYLRFAWKATGGNAICLQLAHDGTFGPGGSGREGAKFRYHAGPGGECYGASLVVDEKLPAKFEVVTRDLFLDFGEFTLTGLAFSPADSKTALFDHLYLARQVGDFELIPKKK